MPNYDALIDAEVWDFIHKTAACYPPDTASRSIAEQRDIYDEMCKFFYAGRPKGLKVEEATVGDVHVRIYGECSNVHLVYFHGGGFVVGNLDSHDDVCAEIAARTGIQVVSADYRLSPENLHPAAFEDALAVTRWALGAGDVILAGDSAGGNLAAAVSGEMRHQLLGQVLIYPSLGGDMDKGSYLEHANAPMLTRDEVIYYSEIRGGKASDPSLSPLIGSFQGLPPTIAFAAECDPLADDCLNYVNAIHAKGGQGRVLLNKGLVHGHLRARHMSKRARESFEQILQAINALANGDFLYE